MRCWLRTVELNPNDYAAHHNLALPRTSKAVGIGPSSIIAKPHN